MTCSRICMRILYFCSAFGALTLPATVFAIDATWGGANLDNWTTGAWATPALGYPMAARFEAGLIGNNTTAVVNQVLTDFDGVNGVNPDEATGGVTLGNVANSTGGLTIQSGGNLLVRPATDGTTAFLVNGAVTVGTAGIGTLTINNGGTLTATSLTIAGQISGVNQSALNVGDGLAGTATLTVNGGPTVLSRTTKITGPNVNFSNIGVTLESSSTLIADIRGATHSAIKASQTFGVGGILKPTFTGVVPALGNTWNLADAKFIGGTFSSIDASAAPVLPAGQAYQTKIVAGGTNGKLLQLVVEQMLTLEVNRSTGAVVIHNTGGTAVPIDAYSVIAANAGLNSAAWTPQAPANGWTNVLGDNKSLNEVNSNATVNVNGGATLSLGTPYRRAFPAFGTETDDVTFQYNTPSGVRAGLIVYSGNKINNNLVLTVNPTTGAGQLKNDSPFTVSIEGYSIKSTTGSLLTSWTSLADKTIAGWQEASPLTTVLSELDTAAPLVLAPGKTFDFGTVFKTVGAGGTQDLKLEFLQPGQSNATNGLVVYSSIGRRLPADFDSDGDVDGIDLGHWKSGMNSATLDAADANLDGITDGKDFLIWQQQLGTTPQTSAASGAVPEPASFGLLAFGGAALAICRPRRRARSNVTASADAQSPSIAGSTSAGNNLGSCKRSGSMQRIGVHSFVALAAVILSGLFGSAASAKNIIWVSDGVFGADTNIRSDQGFIDLLTLPVGSGGGGHTVTYLAPANPLAGGTGFFSALDDAKVALLNSADLVIVGRAAVSGNYSTTPAEVLLWNSLTVPVMLQTPYLARNTNWNWMNNATIQEPPNPPVATNIFDPLLEAVAPASPIFAGVTLDGSNRVDVIDPASTNNGSSFLGIAVDGLGKVGNGTALAKVNSAQAAGVGPTASDAWIVTWDAGTPYYTGSPQTPSGKRMYFVAGEEGGVPAGANVGFPGQINLTADGNKIFLNAVTLMTTGGPVLHPGDCDGDGDVDPADLTIIKNNYRKSVVGRTNGDVTGDGFVDINDFKVWKDNDPLFTGSLASLIPEPSGLALALFGLAGAARRRRRG